MKIKQKHWNGREVIEYSENEVTILGGLIWPLHHIGAIIDALLIVFNVICISAVLSGLPNSYPLWIEGVPLAACLLVGVGAGILGHSVFVLGRIGLRHLGVWRIMSARLRSKLSHVYSRLSYFPTIATLVCNDVLLLALFFNVGIMLLHEYGMGATYAITAFCLVDYLALHCLKIGAKEAEIALEIENV